MSVASVSYVMVPFLAPRAAEETVWTPILYFYKHRNMEPSPLPIPQVTPCRDGLCRVGLRGATVDPPPPRARRPVGPADRRAGRGRGHHRIGPDAPCQTPRLGRAGRATPRRTAHPLLGRDRRGRGAFRLPDFRMLRRSWRGATIQGTPPMADLTQNPRPLATAWGRIDKVALTGVLILLTVAVFDTPRRGAHHRGDARELLGHPALYPLSPSWPSPA